MAREGVNGTVGVAGYVLLCTIKLCNDWWRVL